MSMSKELDALRSRKKTRQKACRCGSPSEVYLGVGIREKGSGKWLVMRSRAFCAPCAVRTMDDAIGEN